MDYYVNFSNIPSHRIPRPVGVSVTVPGQAPHLKYIIGALKRGESLNIKQNMSYDNDPKFGQPQILDSRHFTSSDVDQLLESFSSDSSSDSESPA